MVNHAVPPNSPVVGVPGRATSKDATKGRLGDLDHDRLPDPVARAIDGLSGKIADLEREVRELRGREAGKEQRDGTRVS